MPMILNLFMYIYHYVNYERVIITNLEYSQTKTFQSDFLSNKYLPAATDHFIVHPSLKILFLWSIV